MTLYTIGRSKKNTVKVEKSADRMLVTLTESGGQYRQWCTTPADVVEYLGRMWGYGCLTDMPEDVLTSKVAGKLKLVSGEDVLQNS